MRRWHVENHRTDRAGWLRAAVLGANDGIISIAGLLVGVAATGASTSAVLGSGVAGIVAGAMSMAAGEYVSVQSQADTETADIAKETRELAEEPEHELQELTHIYVKRGLSPELAALLGSGALAAWVGGAPKLRGALRVGFWGAMAMAAAALIGRLFEVQV